MKILYHHRIASKDGQFVHVEELTNALRELGHVIIIVGPGNKGSADFGSESRLVAGLKRFLPKVFYELVELSYAVVAYLKLRAATIRYKPDILYERYNLFSPAGVWIKKNVGLPLISEVNAPLLEERQKYGDIFLHRLARWSENLVWKNADKVLPVTGVLARKIESVGVPPRNIEIIPNGIDPNRFSQADGLEEAKRRLALSKYKVLGFTGFMREWHGLEKILNLVADDLSGRRFALLVGDGPARSGLEQYARKLGIGDRIRITGVVARDRLVAYLSAFDIALQPSVVHYASPLKIFEYMALGKAIVAPDMPNIREVLQHNHNAFLFEPGEASAFEQAVETVIENPDFSKRLGLAARQTIEEKELTWSANARRIIELMQQITASGAVELESRSGGK